jgi:hypothetical protein
VPLLCANCGLALEGGDEAALFVCTNCGLVHEPAETGLVGFFPLTADVTTQLAYAGSVRYLAVWRVAATVKSMEGAAWEHVCRLCSPRPPHLFVPAFSLMRGVMQRLGTSLTERQPDLQLTKGLAVEARHRPVLVEAGGRAAGGGAGMRATDANGGVAEPGFGRISPIVVSRQDSRTLAHFVYLAVESHDKKDLVAVEYELEPRGEELIFIPAVWDVRQIYESNWRLLLREFDGQVA